MIKPLRYLTLLGLTTLLASCSFFHSKDGPPLRDVDVSKIPNAVPKALPKSKYGNPASYQALGKRYYVKETSKGYKERGVASWYGTKFHSKRTSSGEPYSLYDMTAAHKTLPIPSFVKVTNLENGREIVVKVNDRGPFHENRVIDLSYVAAKKLGITGHGTGLVEVASIDPRDYGSELPLVSTSFKPNSHLTLYLQAGAFSEMNNAERVAEKLRGFTNYPVQIEKAMKDERALYRVRVGPLKDVDTVDVIAVNLKRRGLNDVVTVII